MRKIYLLLLAVILAIGQLLAQQRTITGKVTDDKGNPIPNASVVIKGTSTGTITKNDGSFSLTVPATAKTLVISSLDMEEREVAIGTQSVINISLKASDKSLEEVVVVGYQTVRKREVTSAISKISGDEIKNLPMQSFDRAAQGKLPGVDIRSSNGTPGGAVNVRIRGIGSITSLSNNEPLYIVDGVQINSGTVSFGTTFTQTNPLGYLNPNDIESIEVLKDAAAASIYGARGGNGVVLITTKKGKGNRSNITFNTYYGVTSPLKMLKVATTQQYIQVRAEAYANALNLPNINTPNASLGVISGNPITARQRVLSDMGLNPFFTDKQIDSLPTYDWQDAAFQQGQIKNVELSVANSSEKTNLYMSGGYVKQDAIVVPADFVRGNFLANIGHRINSKLLIESQITLSAIKQTATFATEGSFLGSPAFSSSLILPHNPIYNQDGTYYGLPPASINGVLNQNVIAVVNFNKSNQRTKQIVGNVGLTYEIIKGLRYKNVFGIDYRLVQATRFTDPRTPDGFAVRGRLTEVSNWNTNFLTYHTLNYLKTFGQSHNFNFLAGFEYRRDINEQINATGIGFPTFQFNTLNAASTPESMGGFWTGSATASTFGKVTYDFAKKYFLTASLRYDGSSRFGEENKYGTFPSVSAAWNIKSESFLLNNKVVSDLKLRASWGHIGNDQIGNFPSRGLYGITNTYNGQGGIGPTQLANPKLRWEDRRDVNAGIDYGFFNNRLSGSIDVYQRDNDANLISRPLTPSTGWTSVAQNLGSVRNKGFEFLIRGRILTGTFSWTTNFNISYNKNEITKLYDTLKSLPSDASIAIGQSLGSWFLAPYAGVNPATGRAMWYDIKGNITYNPIAADRRFSGKTLNSYFGGFTNTFAYKGFELETFFNYEYGRKVSDAQVNFLSEVGGRAFNFLTDVADRRWQKPGDITDVPRPINGNAEVRGAGNFTGTRPLLKADYIRLKQVTLSYNLASDLLRRFKVTNAKFYVQGINLWTYTDYPGYDPEFGGATTAVSTGIIPQSKNVTVGLQLNF